MGNVKILLYTQNWGVDRFFNWLNYLFYSNEISFKANIGDGTTFYHHGLGVVVHDNAVIGKQCRIFQNVTIGSKWENGTFNNLTPPIIGDNAFIGAGACIIGNIIIGNNVVIGANSLVNSNIPDNCCVVGVPARIVKYYK